MLVDSHCHLDFPELAGEIDAVMARAKQSGVGLFLTISTSLETFPRVLAVAEALPQVYCTVGVHPHEAATSTRADQVDRLIALAQHPKVVGIGETGLDYYYEHSPREAQATAFRAHMAAAQETGLPLIVHSRDADEDTGLMLNQAAKGGRLRGLLHCFSSGEALANQALDLGFLISFSGILTFKNAEPIRQIATRVPQERLLVETDAPFLAPVPFRGRRCEPAFVAQTAMVLAKLRHISEEDLAKITTDNFMRLFTKVPQRPDLASA